MTPNSTVSYRLSDLLKKTRQHFWKLGFDEVEVPYLNSQIPNESNIYPFETFWTHTKAKYYLPTSPEFALKKYLSQTRRNCFSISHCFRDLEDSGPHHHPEFLMLEWYEVGKNYRDLMTSLKKYLDNFIKLKYTEISLPPNLPQNEPDFNQFFLNQIEPKLTRHDGVFVTGYPAFLSPFASFSRQSNIFSARSERDPPLAESPKVASTAKNSLIGNRFELYINGIEIANACTENRNRQQLKPYLSKSLLADFCSIPDCAGIGVGLERLLMILNGQNHL